MSTFYAQEITCPACEQVGVFSEIDEPRFAELEGQMSAEIISLTRSQYLDLHWRTADSSLRTALAGRPFIDVQRLAIA